MAERLLPKQKVAGSIPVCGSLVPDVSLGGATLMSSMSFFASEPFGNGSLIVLDSLRILATVGSATLAGLYIGMAINRTTPRALRTRYFGSTMLLVVIFFTMLERLGHPLTWKLPLSGVGIAVLGAGHLIDRKPPRFERHNR